MDLPLNYFVPPVFQLRGGRFNVADLNFGVSNAESFIG
jgi:hypothetical protein